MINRKSLLMLVAGVLLGACGGQAESSSEDPRPTAIATAALAETNTSSEATKPSYVPRFDDREGATYFYATAVSEEDQKKGKSLGSVSSFQYRGERDGMHSIASVDEGGRTLISYQCSKPCKIIKRTFRGEVDRLPFDARTVIGAAFADALNGSLEVATSTKTAPEAPRVSAVIPAAFVGEWNADLSACGTDNDDSRLRVNSDRIRFYESDGEVREVTIVSPRSVKVRAAFSGEGQRWTETVALTLSRSGSELTSAGSTRKKCAGS